MTQYQSDLKTISSSEEVVFGMLSDLNNIGKLKDNNFFSEKLKILEYDKDNCLLEIDHIGKLGFTIIEREAYKTIKLKSFHLPIEMNAMIHLNQTAENSTEMRLTLAAELPSMIKIMLNKKLEKGINTLADFFENFLNTQSNK
jgi:hypothetical protein